MITNIAGKRTASARGGGVSGRARAAFLALELALSITSALLITVFFLGRANPLQATRFWLGSLVAVFLLFALWQLAFAYRLLRLPEERLPLSFRPAATLAAVLAGVTILTNVGLYTSDGINHLLTIDPAFRGAFAVLLFVVLYAIYRIQGNLVHREGGRPLVQLLAEEGRHRGTVVALVAAGLVGLLHGTSYVTAIGDDYARYWAIADALSSGRGYPASEVQSIYQAGGMSSYLVDLPGLPLFMILSFQLLGHTVFAAMAPALVGASLFTLMSYLAFRELTEDTVVSLVSAVLLTMFPLLCFYVLRSGEPDGMFLTMLMTLAFLALRCDRNPHSRWAWPALGLVAALAALTRPEGIAYLGLTFVVLALFHWSSRGFWVASCLAAAILAAFSITMLVTFGTPWPTSFVGAVKLEHIGQNVDGFFTWALPRYSAALGVPQAVLVMLMAGFTTAYVAGAWLLARRKPQLLFLALLPMVSLLLFLLASPALTRPQFPYDFFRRASYGLPFAVLVASYAIAVGLRTPARQGMGQVAMGLLLVASVLVGGYQAKLGAEPEETYQLRTQILTSGTYLLATDMLAHPYQLPRMSFQQKGQAVVVSDSFDYLAFRTGLSSFFAPMDLHGTNRARGYVTASLVLFLVGLFYAFAARRSSA